MLAPLEMTRSQRFAARLLDFGAGTADSLSFSVERNGAPGGAGALRYGAPGGVRCVKPDANAPFKDGLARPVPRRARAVI